MQDELKKVISQAMKNNSKFEQEPIAQFDGELSDEALEEVAGGCWCHCSHNRPKPYPWYRKH
jgi:hypothetical protein